MLKEIPKKCKPNAKQTINCEGNLVGAYAFLLPPFSSPTGEVGRGLGRSGEAWGGRERLRCAPTREKLQITKKIIFEHGMQNKFAQ